MTLSTAQVRRVRSVLKETSGGKALTATQIQAVQRTLVRESVRRGASPDKAVAETAVVMGRLVTASGKVKSAAAKKPAAKKKAAKAKGPAAETLQQKVDRLIRENLTAALGPKAAPGAGAAPEAAGADGAALMSALASEQRSPFYRPPAGASAASGKGGKGAGGAVAVTGVELAELAAMDPDQLRSFAAGKFKEFATAGGYGSPIWQDGELLSTARG